MTEILTLEEWLKLPAADRIKQHPYPDHNYPCCDCFATATEAIEILASMPELATYTKALTHWNRDVCEWRERRKKFLEGQR